MEAQNRGGGMWCRQVNTLSHLGSIVNRIRVPPKKGSLLLTSTPCLSHPLVSIYASVSLV